MMFSGMEPRRASLSLSDLDVSLGGAQQPTAKLAKAHDLSVGSLQGLNAELKKLSPPDLLRELCGDWFIEPSQLEDMVSLSTVHIDM